MVTPNVCSVVDAREPGSARRADEEDNGGVAPRIEVVEGNIALQEVDLVVNAANTTLSGGGGVDGAIHRRAGARELHAACAALGGCPTGEARLTPGFGLPARHIAHAVGPRWRGGDHGEPELLASCYRWCLRLADEVEAHSLAFPAISTGIYGYPARPAAEVAVATICSTPTAVSLVRLVAFDEATAALYAELLAGAQLDPIVTGGVRELKALLRRHPPDPGSSGDLAGLQALLEIEPRSRAGSCSTPPSRSMPTGQGGDRPGPAQPATREDGGWRPPS